MKEVNGKHGDFPQGEMMTDRLLTIRLILDIAALCGFSQGGEEKNEND
ncbi:hypothetical protein [Eubacterium pyruvativorans]|nr:hypothetical protein [Eubacterium pyruvativorans]